MCFCKKFLMCLHLFAFIHHSTCQRRIVDGKDVTSDKTYMVYLLRSSESKYNYTGWLCGGAIVHPWYILTAAACLYNMERVFVIAGISYYLSEDEIDGDFCAGNTKRRIMRHCAPNKYNFANFDTNGEWYDFDIILGKVDRPYSVDDNDEFKKYACTYVPTTIPVNYNYDMLRQFSDVMALGWGSESVYGTNKTRNSPFLKYTVGYLMEKSRCRRRMILYYNAKSSICFNERGSVDDQGKLLDVAENCEDLHYGCPGWNRRNDGDTNVTFGYNSRRLASWTQNKYRRFGGLCQNDHGGPLVGWIGGKEIVMGVASYFMVATNMSCLGPSVFTSTACVNKFLYCKLKQDGARRSTWCKKHDDFTEETDMPWT